ncbi:MAG: mandelate racemase/muconate lactonizing enzyme family protein [Desulfarculaceae bacterium]|jgi:L-alanine-DL-glutamate epimerase-like enolase superfamily enzyme
MKISKMQIIPLSVPLDRPFRGGRQELKERINPVVVRLFADDGLDAFGVAFAWNDKRVNSLVASISDLEDLVIGHDVSRPAELWDKLYGATRHMGHTGYAIYAMAAIDTAIWGLRAKSLDMPLAQLLGQVRDKVPAYASHMLFRSWSMDQLQKDASLLVEQGFKAVKMNMGDKEFDVEIERLKAVREAVGKDVKIMVDANWAWDTSEAINIGRKIEPYDVYWLEDPLASDDSSQLATVAAALDVRIAIGETSCTKYGFRQLVAKNSGDIFLIDLQRAGGIMEWMKIAGLAQAWNIPVTSHLFHEFSIHLLAATSNAKFLEYMPWYDKIYQEPTQVKDGFVQVPAAPGLGVELDENALKKYKLN